MRAVCMACLLLTACVAPAPQYQEASTQAARAQQPGAVGASQQSSPANRSGQTPLPNGPRDDPAARTGELSRGQDLTLEPLDEPPAEQGSAIEGPEVDLVPTLPAPTRTRKRMNLDQLNRAIVRATGGIAWTAANGSNEFTNLALTLGKPNYTDVTNEDLLPGALFQKFLADAAHSVCFKLVNKELTISDPSKRVLIHNIGLKATIETHPAEVDANLVWLLKRFHSRVVPVGAQELEPYRFLFQAATKVSGGQPDQAWRAVCATLIQHPHFYTY